MDNENLQFFMMLLRWDYCKTLVESGGGGPFLANLGFSTNCTATKRHASRLQRRIVFSNSSTENVLEIWESIAPVPQCTETWRPSGDCFRTILHRWRFRTTNGCKPLRFVGNARGSQTPRVKWESLPLGKTQEQRRITNIRSKTCFISSCEGVLRIFATGESDVFPKPAN